MTLLRAAARTMLASHFVISGVKALRDPAALVPAAEPLTDKLVPVVKKYAPDQVAQFIPEDAKTLVRVNGAAQVVGGLALATGRGRRLGAFLLAGSLVPSTIAKYPFWSESDPELKAQQRSHFGKNLSLLGGVLLAARDTEGKPGVAWRAQRGGQSLVHDTRKAAKKLTKSSSGFGDTASDFAEGALASGAALVGAVAKSTRKSRKQAKKQLLRAAAVAAEQAEQARKAAAAAAKQAKKDAPKQLRAAQKFAAEQAAQARAAAKIAQKEGRKQLRTVQKRTKKVRGNISLGEN
jgi:uncharacterized membrane protein YphA (DoxX/SURF4 family)